MATEDYFKRLVDVLQTFPNHSLTADLLKIARDLSRTYGNFWQLITSTMTPIELFQVLIAQATSTRWHYSDRGATTSSHRGVPLSWGGGAGLIFGHVGTEKTIIAAGIETGEEVGVSAGVLYAYLRALKMKPAAKVVLIKTLVIEQNDLFSLLFNNPLNPLTYFLGDGLADMLPRAGVAPFTFWNFERVDLRAQMAKLIEFAGTPANLDNTIFLAWDLNHGETCAFDNSEPYDLASVLAGACRFSPMMIKDVTVTWKGKVRNLVDYGFVHCHPSNFFKDGRAGIVSQLMDMTLFRNRSCDYQISAGLPGALPFGRMTESQINAMVDHGEKQARQALAEPLKRGLIPTAHRA